MSATDVFADQIFQYIVNQYGKNTLNKVKADKHKALLNKLIDSASHQNDTVEHAANKIIAMLRMNP